jgi:alpha-1,6-mannosyltransferase
LANFVMPRSGGLRTALTALGEGYRAAGHEPILVVPGTGYTDRDTPQGRVITLPGTRVPGTGGYRVLLGRRRLRRLLDELRPDRLEVSDRTTLRWTGRWAARRGIPSVMVSHESVSGLLRLGGRATGTGRLGVADWFADRLNARTARWYTRVVCTTSWAAAEFRRLGVSNVEQIPLGVDLDVFHPDRYDPELRAEHVAADRALIVHCGRLSPEKCPGRSVDALAALLREGVDAVLVVAGDGPLRGRLARQAAGLPVRFVDFVADRKDLAALLATADVVLSPGPVETFGLAALEALACGTPVVVDSGSALPEVIGEAGVAVAGTAEKLAGAVRQVLDRPEDERRTAARRRAEEFGWRHAVAGFLAAHGA